MRTLEEIKTKYKDTVEIGIILGSGLGDLANNIDMIEEIKYGEIESFHNSTVEGHNGRFIIGELSGKNVIAMDGRLHFYEGIDIKEVVKPADLMLDLGIKTLIVTNAAGGVNNSFTPGDLMVISDHINYAGINPLIGPNDESKGPRFVDMTNGYSKDLINKAKKVAKNINLDLKEGVYMWFTGPNYETPAEVKMAGILGADAVGMSTVPEVLIAKHRGVDVLGFSCITNMAAGITDDILDHDDVIKVSLKVRDNFKKLIMEVLKEI